MDDKSLVSEPTVPLELRRAFSALVATAMGTMAGLLVDSGFSIQMSIVNFFYRLLQPLFDVFSAYPNGQLVLAGLVYRTPVVLMVGLLVGLLLRRLRYRRLLLCSIPVWPVYLVGRRLVFLLLIQFGGQDGAAHATATTFLQSLVLPEMVFYAMQYSLLYAIIYATNTALLRSERRPAT